MSNTPPANDDDPLGPGQSMNKLALLLGMTAGTILIDMLPKMFRDGIVDRSTMELARAHLAAARQMRDIDDQTSGLLADLLNRIEKALTVQKP